MTQASGGAAGLLRATVAVLAATMLGVVLWLSAGPMSALASCATDTPVRSPAAFTGTVLSTRSRGRVANVRTDAGATVEVQGTPDVGSAATSVDRTYEVGGRYEFHPVNDSSPFQDNSCTATHLLSTGPAPAAPAIAGQGLAAVAVVIVVLAAGVAATVLLRRRARRRSSAAPR